MSNTIYTIKNKINSKVYIGQTYRSFGVRKKEHLNQYKKEDYHIYRAMRKYGIENFIIEPICSVINQDDLDDLEIQFINEYDSFHNGYNMTIGGSGVMRDRKFTKEHKDKLSKSLTGKIVSREHRNNLSKANTGKIQSKKQRDNISNANKGKKCYKWLGYYHTPFGVIETLDNILDYTNDVSRSSIYKWCNNPNKIITIMMTSRSKYLTEEMLGKTFKEIGFWFEPI